LSSNMLSTQGASPCHPRNDSQNQLFQVLILAIHLFKIELVARGLLKLCLGTECICYNPNAPEGYNAQSKATGD